jgi:hypothetical protein
MIKKIINLLLLLSLASCGGGGGGTDEIPIPKTSITSLLSIWTNLAPDPDCISVTLGDNTLRRQKEGPLLIIDNRYIESYLYYDDNDTSCTTITGGEIHTFSIEWSAPTSTQTKNGAVRAIIRGYTTNTFWNFSLNPIPINDVTYKVLFYVENGILNSYFDVVTPNLDDEGYPLGTDAPLFRYSKGGPDIF